MDGADPRKDRVIFWLLAAPSAYGVASAWFLVGHFVDVPVRRRMEMVRPHRHRQGLDRRLALGLGNPAPDDPDSGPRAGQPAAFELSFRGKLVLNLAL